MATNQQPVVYLAPSAPIALDVSDNNPAQLALATGGSGGAVRTVNGQTGDVTLTGLQKVADTGTGFALQNGTPTILSWTAPNDGQNHRFMVIATIDVTIAETGGTLTASYTDPAGNVSTPQITAGGSGVQVVNGNYRAGIVKAGTTVTVAQSSALTSGAATLFAEIWAS